jgi:hypothetical protein
MAAIAQKKTRTRKTLAFRKTASTDLFYRVRLNNIFTTAVQTDKSYLSKGVRMFGAICHWRVLAVALLFGSAMTANAAPKDACAHLVRRIDTAPPGPVFLASYPTAEPGPLADTAFLYDNALAALALVGCGERARAERIGQAILSAQTNDRFWKDGRLRNAYAAGAASEKPVKLPGWWDKRQNRWLEDRYQVGSDVGNQAWAMLAMLALDTPGAETPYRAGAARLAEWIAQWRDTRGAGGFTGGVIGHEPSPEPRRWKSTEHNIDLTAAFTLLADRTGEAKWRDLAGQARHFVEAMWNPDGGFFPAGTGEDGTTPNPTLSLDAQIWPLTALPDGGRFGAALDTADKKLGVDDGYSYGEARDGIWTEGTAQVALLQKKLGNKDRSRALIAIIESQRSPEGGYYATSSRQLPTGYGLESDPAKPRLYFRLPHLGAASWAALAECGFDPFSLKTL